ncbi:hypothetical protein [Chryseobacterium sp. MEBOG07]|uniref:hypothetical protein n=1 Tax=Chryseobacterium sp. MEBOG07 TaxID=2879939 RepID=UPI001F394D4C|nr:hypothetical protein [Chryseobacterium sp. MEBOG07]UKB81294.1 hypothetical protein LF886_09970 [Chryseobacterium sp. MEBOG07]
MTKSLTAIIELSKNDEFETDITLNQIIQAKSLINIEPKNKIELFSVICSMNLINAAIKNKKFQEQVYYGMLKPKVSQLLIYIIENETFKSEVQFYIEKADRCAYIEINNLQFGFHNITIDKKLQNFIESPDNNPKPWKGIRLQKIAGELFNYAIDNRIQ